MIPLSEKISGLGSRRSGGQKEKEIFFYGVMGMTALGIVVSAAKRTFFHHFPHTSWKNILMHSIHSFTHLGGTLVIHEGRYTLVKQDSSVLIHLPLRL